ncbi:Multidrug resistance protein B [[Actinomadura] parvosata subsp. kistnae]|uniref:MFS transporter n=1 Tax=[Actinomadura] parvosata subsp. kistnae TaxID=1909395 RepID=A0A1V0AEL1_9ACTN|nr:DHA2 family efflux MFS transporter permease subunit [Nonomuraea sp. ATCC 55076]AQZ68648.1 MFS transporter [Nonomuraea sp. ATCC 55076]SPL92871.1 Multidrug resistance protein B [Actinomadura parvosata subsp. kistnae]
MSRLTRPELRAAVVLASGGLMAVLDATIVAVALPGLMAAFGTALTSVQWIITAYTLAMVATMPLAAGLAARWGARRVYVVALAGFAVASAVAGAAGGLGWLIAARAAQGLSGGLMAPLGMAIGFGAVAPERRGRMMAITGLPMLVGPILGPVLGAALLGAGSWRALFLVTVPLALLGIAGTLAWLPPDPARDRAARLDLAGAVLLVPGVVGVAFGISAQDGPAWVRLATAILGVALVAAFSVRALTHPEPLLRVGLLRNPTFGAGAAVLALYAAPYFGSALLMPAYVQVLRGDGASVTAALMVPGAVGMGVSLQIAARLLERLGPRRVVGTGLGLAIAAGLLSVLVLRPDTPYPVLGVLGFLQGAGTGAIMMPTMSSSSRDLNGPDLASGSALLSLVNTVANGLGTVAVSALFTVLTAAVTGGASLIDLSGPGGSAQVAAAVDALRWTQAAAVVVMSLALLVRLRFPRPASAILDGREAAAKVGGVP